MLDQDTARALLTIADEARRAARAGGRPASAARGRPRRGARPRAPLGRPRRLRHARCGAPVHPRRHRRRRRQTPVPDVEYARAQPSRCAPGDEPGAVFDALLRPRPDPAPRQRADRHARARRPGRAARRDGHHVAVVVDTREQAAALNAAIRDRLVAAGRRRRPTRDEPERRAADRRRRPWSRRAATTTDLDVANRDTWTVTRVHRRRRAHRHRAATAAARAARRLRARARRARPTRPPRTARKATPPPPHTWCSATTPPPRAPTSAMTRGRETNTAHLVAADLDDAREQWVDAFARDRADLGPRTPPREPHARPPAIPSRPSTHQVLAESPRGAGASRPTSNVSCSAPPRCASGSPK